MKLADYPDVFREGCKELTRIRAFSLSLIVPECRETVVRPLLSLASDCFVYGLQSDSRLAELIAPIILKEKGKWRLLLDQEVITGYGLLWAVGPRGCGSVLLLVPFQIDSLRQVFDNCYGPILIDNIGAGHTRSAIRYAREGTMDGRTVGFAFSGSNGIETLDVFGREDVLESLYKLAAETCEIQKPETGY